MNKAEILELALRVEALEGPDRKVLWEAFNAIYPKPTTIWEDEDRNQWTAEYEAYYERSWKFSNLLEVGGFIDAAMGLVPAETFWRVGHDADDPAWMTAQVSHDRGEGRLGFTTGTASTPANAITAACLRAIAEMGKDNG